MSFGGNSEAATDFQIDRTGPVISFPNGDTCSGSLGSSITTNGATISWNLNEGGTGQVEYGTSATLTGSSLSPVPAQSSATSHAVALSNLDSNTTYYFRVEGTNSGGTTNGSTTSFTTAACGVPTVTTGAATSINETTATLNASVNDQAVSASYVFAWATNSGLTSPTTATVNSTTSGTHTVSKVVTGLSCGLTYYLS